MKVTRLWIEIVTTPAAVAFALALLIATLGAVAESAVAALGQAQTAPVAANWTYEGMVTCSRCGARHSVAIGKAASDCTRMCVHDGAKFALVSGDSTYLLEGDQFDLKRFAGERARITGSLRGNTIQVLSVSSLAAAS